MRDRLERFGRAHARRRVRADVRARTRRSVTAARRPRACARIRSGGRGRESPRRLRLRARWSARRARPRRSGARSVPIPARLRGWTPGLDTGARQRGLGEDLRAAGRLRAGVLPRPQRRARAAIAADPNGALIELTEPELERLDLREMRYQRVRWPRRSRPRSASTQSSSTPPGLSITARSHRRTRSSSPAIRARSRPRSPRSARVSSSSIERTTAPPPAEISEATLVRDRIPPGNPRAW